MKTRILLIIIFALVAFSINTFAQVGITSEKVTYQRTVESLPDYKKSFEINYPKISGITDPSVLKNLEETLSYWKNFDQSLEENLNEIPSVDSADFIVNYNKNSVLDITLLMDVSGAYPSTLSKHLVIDLKTGTRVFIKDVFTNLGPLLIKIDKAKKADEAKTIAELKKENREDAVTLREMLNEKIYSINTLEEFSVNNTGATFFYDYGFPHAVQALAPNGTYFFSWAEMKPFINRDGLLGQFAR